MLLQVPWSYRGLSFLSAQYSFKVDEICIIVEEDGVLTSGVILLWKFIDLWLQAVLFAVFIAFEFTLRIISKRWQTSAVKSSVVQYLPAVATVDKPVIGNSRLYFQQRTVACKQRGG